MRIIKGVFVVILGLVAFTAALINWMFKKALRSIK